MTHTPSSPHSIPPLPIQPSPSEEDSDAPGAYGWPFWFAYLHNFCLMLPLSMLYRYSDLVHALGGTDWDLAWIVGVGMIGSLIMRLAQGVGIDQYGPARLWMASTFVFALTCYSHVWLQTAHGLAIYLVRICFQTAVAGAFGASTTYISHRVSVPRVAEVIGTLGTSGFIAMICGTKLGDVLCGGSNNPTPDQVHNMFYVATGCGVLSLLFAMLATRGAEKPIKHERPPLITLLRTYHPGLLLVVALTVGVAIGLPTNYLTPYTQELGLPGIAMYFWVYAPAAFATRLASRGWPQRFGIRPMVCFGLGSVAVSMCLYLVVAQQWMLVLPAVFAGIGHAFLFPSVVGGGSTVFPPRYRGLGVMVMSAVTDIGTLIGMPLAGLILRGARHLGWPAYPTMFVTLAVLTGTVCVLYSRFGPLMRLGEGPEADEAAMAYPSGATTAG